MSSYDKSVEVPSSFLEPSIVFDEKEGKSGPAMMNHVSRYKFKPIFARQNGKPSILENKITEGVQIKPIENESDSLISCSMSDFQTSDKSNISFHNILGIPVISSEKDISYYYGKEPPIKKKEKQKRQLKDYITQVDQNAGLSNLVKKTAKEPKIKNRHVRQDSRVGFLKFNF
jgi:hypothetical protein